MSTNTTPTQEEMKEAHRQEARPSRNAETVAEGSHAIDHGTVYDNAVSEDTNKEPVEDITARNRNDLSFWGGKWTWVESNNAYGNKPEDRWFVNPTPQLIGLVMEEAGKVHDACATVLENTTEHKETLEMEKLRHLTFFQDAFDGELVSEALDMLNSYQDRFFEAVQQYLGRQESYQALSDRDDSDEERVEQLRERKAQAASLCRHYTAKLISVVTAYHAVVDDERAYNLQYNFRPKEGTREYNLLRFSVSQSMNRIGRRLARSIKDGKLDAAQYNIPRPWTEEAQKDSRRKADEMISDFA